MAKDLEELGLGELQERLEKLRSLQARCEQGTLDISDRPLLLELVSGFIEEVERNGQESVTLELPATESELTDKVGIGADVKESASKNPQR